MLLVLATFPMVLIKYSEESNLKEKGHFGLRFSDRGHHSREFCQQEPEKHGHMISAARKQETMNAHVQISPCMQSRIWATGNDATLL